MEWKKLIDAAFINLDEISNYWLVRTQGGEYYEDYHEGGFIAFGYNYISIDDLNGPVSTVFDQIKEKISEKEPDVKNPGLPTNQMIKFSREMEEGDIVLIPSEGSKLISFGIVASEVLTKNNIKGWIQDACPFEKRRRVRWIKTLRKSELNPYLYKIVFTHQALTSIEEYKDQVHKALYYAYRDDQGYHIVLDVTSTEPIGYYDFSKFGTLFVESSHVLSSMQEDSSSFDTESIDSKLIVESPGTIELIVSDPITIFYIIGLIQLVVFGGKAAGVELKGFLSWFRESKEKNANSEKIKELETRLDELENQAGKSGINMRGAADELLESIKKNLDDDGDNG